MCRREGLLQYLNCLFSGFMGNGYVELLLGEDSTMSPFPFGTDVEGSQQGRQEMATDQARSLTRDILREERRGTYGRRDRTWMATGEEKPRWEGTGWGGRPAGRGDSRWRSRHSNCWEWRPWRRDSCGAGRHWACSTSRGTSPETARSSEEDKV